MTEATRVMYSYQTWSYPTCSRALDRLDGTGLIDAAADAPSPPRSPPTSTA